MRGIIAFAHKYLDFSARSEQFEMPFPIVKQEVFNFKSCGFNVHQNMCHRLEIEDKIKFPGNLKFGQRKLWLKKQVTTLCIQYYRCRMNSIKNDWRNRESLTLKYKSTFSGKVTMMILEVVPLVSLKSYPRNDVGMANALLSCLI